MLSKELEQALNDQINYELGAMYAYMAMAAWLEQANLTGCAKWMGKQAFEEYEHAMKIYEHVFDRGGNVTYQAIAKPNNTFKDVRDVFENGLKLEQGNTANINKLYEAALGAKDYPAQIMLQWFIDEQVEEEKSFADILAQLDMIQDNPAGLLMFDGRLGSREGS